MSNCSFTHGSLFSGIGGFDLAAEWMGWENIFHCEWNSFGQKVLKHYWPNATSYEDITSTDFTIHRGGIDILTGGFPYQPYSAAGKRLGKEDDRHLWPEMLRAIREIQPLYVVGENVRGLTNWNGGMVFDEVQADLENQGYEVLPFLLPACAVNAPHRRDRIWFVANTTSNGHDAKPKEGNNKVGENNQQSRAQRKRTSEGFSDERNAADSESIWTRQQQQNNREWQNRRFDNDGKISDATNSTSSRRGKDNRFGESRFNDKNSSQNNWQNFPTVSPVCFGDDGLSDRLDSITFPKWRNESIKAGGNAIVPQVAYQIFKAISQ
jgi:DNA (cytosine-5)-methyltransferase 1